MKTVAALFVHPRGPYQGLEGVDPWDQKRDARLYQGPHPVVAHPPCSRWCRLAGLVQARWGHAIGGDDGCFASALASVRRWGGVLEHPAGSLAWTCFGLPAPDKRGGWQRTLCGGWVCHVEQWHYGHLAKKSTWLYVHGVGRPPELRWGMTPDNAVTAYVTDGGGDATRRGRRPPALVSYCGNKISSGEKRPRLTKKQAAATPPAFRDVLLEIARSAQQ